MFGFWILLSGKFDLFHLTLGVISSLLIAFFSHDLIFADKERKGRLPEAFRFIGYFPYLLYKILTANLHVAKLALHPKMSRLIDPKIVRFKSKLKKDIARVTLANSITLTPGTITVRCDDGEFYVHALDKTSASDLPGKMEERVAKVFKEG